MVAASMLAAYTCDIEGLQQVAYRMIYPAAALFGLVGIVALQRLTVRGERAELKRLQEGDGVVPLRARSLIRMFAVSARILRTDTRFSHYILAQLCVGVANQLTLAVVVMLISQDLDIGFAAGYWVSTALIVGLPKLLLLGSISRWGRLFDRLGVVRFRVVNVMCWISSLSFGLLATLVIVYRDILGPGFVIWAVLLFAIRGLLYGLGMGGGRLAWNIGHLHFSRSEEAEIYMGIHVSLTGIRGPVRADGRHGDLEAHRLADVGHRAAAGHAQSVDVPAAGGARTARRARILRRVRTLPPGHKKSTRRPDVAGGGCRSLFSD